MSSIEFVSKDKKSGRTVFYLNNSNPAMANSLRRLMIDSVPTIAIEDVEFRKNSSAIYDEILAHRLGLVPLTTDLKSYTLPQECKCNGEGCGRCTVILSLKAKGPGNVYANELKSKDPAVKPIFPEMIIAKLLDKQELEIEATAVLGQGKVHVKWSPGLVWFTNKPNITVNNSSSKIEEFREKYPPQIIKDGKIDKQSILDLNLVDACEDICPELIKVEYAQDSFVFYLEPWGQLTPREIFATALEIFDKQLKELEEKLEK